jgi:hypothetical protein
MLSLASLHKIKDIRPGNIYVENIRSVFDISRVEARRLCEMAVASKVFEKRIGFICPDPSCNGRILADYACEKDIPEEITCEQCELNGNDEFIYKTSNLDRVEFYRLKKY